MPHSAPLAELLCEAYDSGVPSARPGVGRGACVGDTAGHADGRGGARRAGRPVVAAGADF